MVDILINAFISLLRKSFLIADIDCKLKSAAQTPAPLQNHLHGNVPEFLGRPVTSNDAQIFYKAVSCELSEFHMA